MRYLSEFLRCLPESILSLKSLIAPLCRSIITALLREQSGKVTTRNTVNQLIILFCDRCNFLLSLYYLSLVKFEFRDSKKYLFNCFFFHLQNTRSKQRLFLLNQTLPVSTKQIKRDKKGNK